MNSLEKKLNYLLINLSWEKDKKNLKILYKLIAQTRDIINGKGELDLTWMQLSVWYKYYPELAYNAFYYIVKDTHKDLENHQYGSWKDIKYFFYYLKMNSIQGENHPLINRILLNIVIPELKKEELLYMANNKIGLIGRWIPREKSSNKFNWIFKKIASMMYPSFCVEPKNGWSNREQMLRGQLKQRIYLKKLLVKLSGEDGNDTPQVKMCNKRWKELNFNKMTSITLRNQKNAILNKTKKGDIRYNTIDRISCSKNYASFVKESVLDKNKIKGKRLDVGQLAKDGYNYDSHIDDKYNTLRNTINLQWKSNSENNKGLENLPIVAMCDTSGSMEQDECVPLNNSIGLSIRISEICHPAFRDRILTFDSVPKWIRLDDCKDFVEKAKKVKESSWGCNTDFHFAIDRIIETLKKNEIEPKAVKNLILAVFSDMQFDSREHNISIFDCAYEIIKDKFYQAGITTKWKTPYEAPHILFWNLRKTSGFPSTVYQKNITFLSGFNSSLLNIFVNKGIKELRKVTPFDMLTNMLNNRRYNPMDENIYNIISIV